ncbi:hypothetical protein [Kutzneria albida]|uniref:Secreted protein n=1 Tax=Kutzneria albida DSM 43870 TaxID=1449976 RepID=W5W1Q2_9PSEU|nr:hypothetical protein [Kutzneria albida]AHH94481.1 hypothetical protein KALB_1108 [Kutzneria albida DSM 43870]
MHFATRALRHGLAATAVVTVTCGAVALVTASTLTSAQAQLAPLTARATARVEAASPDSVRVSWPLPDGRTATATVPLDAAPPRVGSHLRVGYDPAAPEHAVVPGAVPLVEADRAGAELTVTLLALAAVLAVSAVRVASRARLHRKPAQEVLLRRVRVQSGLVARSWLEIESLPQRWIPVYFDPVLVTLPTPSTVRLFGDPRQDRLVAAEVDGVRLYPSGLVTRTEPRGRRVDNPSEVDDSVRARIATARGVLAQLRADAVLVVPAPLIGLLWAYLDDGGVAGWLGATAVMASVALWLAALRGSDPS